MKCALTSLQQKLQKAFEVEYLSQVVSVWTIVVNHLLFSYGSEVVHSCFFEEPCNPLVTFPSPPFLPFTQEIS